MRNKKKIVAILTGSLMVAGVAWAAWTASGTGNGFGEATTAQTLGTNDAEGLAAVATTTELEQLYPGSSGDVEISITNPNPYTVTLTSITLDDPITSGDAACDASSGVTFGTAGAVTGSWTVPADSTGTEFTLDEAAHMDNTSVDDCQGKTFTIPVSLSGASDPQSGDPD